MMGIFCRSTSQQYALKIINRSKCVGYKIPIENEVSILTQMNKHPNVIQVLDVISSPSALYLVMELVHVSHHIFWIDPHHTRSFKKNSFLELKYYTPVIMYLLEIFWNFKIYWNLLGTYFSQMYWKISGILIIQRKMELSQDRNW